MNIERSVDIKSSPVKGKGFGKLSLAAGSALAAVSILACGDSGKDNKSINPILAPLVNTADARVTYVSALCAPITADWEASKVAKAALEPTPELIYMNHMYRENYTRFLSTDPSVQYKEVKECVDPQDPNKRRYLREQVETPLLTLGVNLLKVKDGKVVEVIDFQDRLLTSLGPIEDPFVARAVLMALDIDLNAGYRGDWSEDLDRSDDGSLTVTLWREPRACLENDVNKEVWQVNKNGDSSESKFIKINAEFVDNLNKFACEK